MDLLISLVIVVMMILSSMSIIKESLRIFLQGAPENIDPVNVYDTLADLNCVEGIHGLHIWSVSSTEIFLSCHISIGKKNYNGDLVIQEINSILKNKFGINHTTLQIENSQLCDTGQGKCCNT